ncbi:trypsin-like peptidase domain-containing protein [Streptomyces sp. NPDC004111]|uniref:nSTAND1 domain-containing NTPase n=1 Tax=Streptomyces sp. NPDC004111 TaxID=3364690 RepID=UPI0036982EFC
MLGADGRAVGAGFLVGRDTAFTCAHVVRAAGQEPGGRVEIAFPGLPGTPSATGQVLTEGWRDPEAQDIAVLRLTGLPQRAGGLPVGVAAGCRGHRVFSFGFPAQALGGGHFGYATAADLLGGQDETGPLLQLSEANGLTTGFSGAPVVDEMTGLVVGMVTAVVSPDTHLKGLDIAYATPAEVLREAWPRLAERQVCPYRGLEPFGAQHAQWFHGRERAVEKVLAAFAGNRRLLMLLGPSGAGKSSLVNAGVLPALADGAIPGSDRWLPLVTRPGRGLLAQLEESGLPGATDGSLVDAAEARLAAEPEHDRLLLVIDQFEELLTQPTPTPHLGEDHRHGGDGRIRAVQELAALAASPVPVTLLLITRNDFYAPLAELAPDLIDAASPGMCNIPGTLGRPELEAIVTRPAQTVGLPWEPGLPERIVNDVLDADPTTRQAPAVLLPALELALRQLWLRRRREDGRLTHAAYDKIGGVTGSMTAWCNQALAQLPHDHRTTAQHVLTALVRPADTEHGTPATRQLIPLTQLRELTADPRPAQAGGISSDSGFDAVLAALTGYRIITTNTITHPSLAPGPQAPGEATAELIHDALLRDWTDLRDWVAQDHQFQVWLQRTREQHALHTRSGLPDDLLKGSLLAEGNEWATHRALTPQITALLHASRQQQQKALRRTRRLNTILGTLLALALIATGIAFYQQRAATNAERTAQSRQLAALSATLADSDLELSSLLAVKAWKTSPTAEAAAALYAAPAATLLLSHQVAHSHDMAWSSDGTRLATADISGTARVWDTETGKALTPLEGATDAVGSVALSSDGTRLATADVSGTARVWDTETGKPLTTLEGDTDTVGEVALSSDGKRLATNDGGTARVWDVKTGKPLTTLETVTGTMESVALSSDGKRLATGDDDHTARVWDVKTGKPLTTLTGHTDTVGSVAFSSDGTRLATADYGGTARVWDVKTGTPLTPRLGGSGTMESVALSSDGKRLATGDDDHTARVWDVMTGKPLTTLTGHTDTVASVAFSSDGTRLVTADISGTARVWDVKTRKPLTALEGATSRVGFVALSSDGTRLATADISGTARVWDTETGKPLTALEGATSRVGFVALSSDGTRLATADFNGTARVWDVKTRKPLITLTGTNDAVGSVALSSDGRRLATGDYNGTARVWDVKTGKPLTPGLSGTDAVGSVALSSDGRRLATNDGGTARVWDVKTGKPLTPGLGGTDTVRSVALSSDGRRLATADDGGTARVWDVKTGKSLTPLEGDTSRVRSVALSSDGRILATADDGGTARVWDTATGKPLTPLEGDTGRVGLVALSSDGRRLATNDGGTARVWDVDLRDAKKISRSICAALSRNFSEHEERQYLQEHDLAPVCGS